MAIGSVLSISTPAALARPAERVHAARGTAERAAALTAELELRHLAPAFRGDGFDTLASLATLTEADLDELSPPLPSSVNDDDMVTS